MRFIPFKYHSEKYVQYWLTLSLMLSLFAFSPAIGNVNAQQLHVVQTEWVDWTKNVSQEEYSHPKKVDQFPDKWYNRSNHYTKKNLSTYLKTVQIAVDHYSPIFYNHQPFFCFSQMKTIPQSSNEVPPFFQPTIG